MSKRARTCPVTGVPLKGVDEAFLLLGGRQLDLTTTAKSDCNQYGLRVIGQTIYGEAVPWTDAKRQFCEQLGLTTNATPTSYYHLHQVPLGQNGGQPILYFTHANSLAAGYESYRANVIARRTRNHSGLSRGKGPQE